MAKQLLGITYQSTPDQERTGIYESEDGVAVFVTDDPYMLSGAPSLQSPMPVFDAGGPKFVDGMGRLQSSLAVNGSGVTPPAGITWDNNTPWDGGTYWI